jgi:hypothetical protein
MSQLKEQIFATMLAGVTVAVMAYLSFAEFDRRAEVQRSLYRMDAHIAAGPVFGTIICEHIYHLERAAGSLSPLDCPKIIRELLEKEVPPKTSVKE